MKNNKLQKAAKMSQKKWIHQEETLLNNSIDKNNNTSYVKYYPKKILRTVIVVTIIIISILGVYAVAKNYNLDFVTNANDSAYISNTENNENYKLTVSLPDGWKCYDEKNAAGIITKRYIKDDKYINVTKYLSGNINLDTEGYTLSKNGNNTKIYQKEGGYKIITKKGGCYYVIESNSSLDLLLDIVKSLE